MSLPLKWTIETARLKHSTISCRITKTSKTGKKDKKVRDKGQIRLQNYIFVDDGRTKLKQLSLLLKQFTNFFNFSCTEQQISQIKHLFWLNSQIRVVFRNKKHKIENDNRVIFFIKETVASKNTHTREICDIRNICNLIYYLNFKRFYFEK